MLVAPASPQLGAAPQHDPLFAQVRKANSSLKVSSGASSCSVCPQSSARSRTSTPSTGKAAPLSPPFRGSPNSGLSADGGSARCSWFDQGGEAETGGMRRNTPDLFQTAS